MEAKTVGYKELLAQRDALEQQIEELRSTEREGVIDEIREMMALYGITPGDLGAGRQKTFLKRAPVVAKYRDPDTGGTWSGRGKPPRWMKDQDRTKFLIPKS